MPVVTGLSESVREVAEKAPDILVDFAVIALGAFTAGFALKRTGMDATVKGLLAATIGIVGMIYGAKSRYLRDFTMGVGIYGVRTVLEAIIP